MTISAALLAAALAVSPSDRMAMADRLFNRGEHAAARKEYLALKGASGVDAEELGYRLVSSASAVGDKAAVRAEGAAFLAAHPAGRHSDRVRLLRALSGTNAEKASELKLLDRDGVAADIRAAALYRMAEATSDSSLYERCFKTDPKGPLAGHAKFRHAYALVGDADPVRRRQGDAELMDLVYGADETLARHALDLVAVHCFHEKRYGECSALLWRYLKKYPGAEGERKITRLLAESELMDGKYASALTLCADESDAELLYVKTVASQRLGNGSEAARLARKYLEEFPAGAARAEVELVIARQELDEAIAGGDPAKILPAAKRCAALAKTGAERLRLAWAYERAGEAENAEAEYAAVARDFPTADVAADALYRRAMSLLRRGKWSAAEVSLAEALASGKLVKERVSPALYWRGMAAHRLGHVEEACGFLRQALEGGGLSIDERREARLLLADEAFNAGRRDEAAAAYASLVRDGALDRMGAAKTLAVGRILSGDEARACARALVASSEAEWRQAGYALLGDIETAATNLTAAAYAYGKCLDQPCTTEAAAPVAVRLGLHYVREGNAADAEKVLERAVKLNANDNEARAMAYLGLARAALLRDDTEGAKRYATVIDTLFENTKAAAEAKEILK
ncbi:MAG: hypothetical protein K6G91_04860 [Kiritimatiellae bacterium]|nr:hypothetical protein [Kiritimatiellia bacterium]